MSLEDELWFEVEGAVVVGHYYVVIATEDELPVSIDFKTNVNSPVHEEEYLCYFLKFVIYDFIFWNLPWLKAG